MKIGIMSDSHDNLVKIRRAVEIFNKEKISLLFHAGDFVSPFTAREIENIHCPLIGVFGNNDGDRLFLLEQFQKIGSIYPEPYKTEIDGKKIIMFHKDDVISDLARSKQYDLIIYGHTHKIDYYKEDKTTVINPGECGGWLTGKSTVAIFDLADLNVHMIELT
ncbi:MAG: metallophosphoesterase [Atribacterota bacterium]